MSKTVTLVVPQDTDLTRPFYCDVFGNVRDGETWVHMGFWSSETD